MMQGVRYRERGPMKSWRPETMAEAIWAVLQEGICFFNFLLDSICILRKGVLSSFQSPDQICFFYVCFLKKDLSKDDIKPPTY